MLDNIKVWAELTVDMIKAVFVSIIRGTFNKNFKLK